MLMQFMVTCMFCRWYAWWRSLHVAIVICAIYFHSYAYQNNLYAMNRPWILSLSGGKYSQVGLRDALPFSHNHIMSWSNIRTMSIYMYVWLYCSHHKMNFEHHKVLHISVQKHKLPTSEKSDNVWCWWMLIEMPSNWFSSKRNFTRLNLIWAI